MTATWPIQKMNIHLMSSALWELALASESAIFWDSMIFESAIVWDSLISESAILPVSLTSNCEISWLLAFGFWLLAVSF